MPEVAVVILNWNGFNFLRLFLDSVVQYSPGASVYVVDNNSSDNSVHFVKTHFPEVKIIRLPKNEGFSKGYNLALRQIHADYYILLNSDVEVTNGWLWPVINFMENRTNVGACQPKIKSFHHKEFFEYAGAAGGYIDKFGYPFCRGRIFNDLEKDNGQYNDVTEIFWATGACLFIKAEVYWLAGGLDNDFFAHMEEIDLCWRIKNAGFRNYYYGFSEVYHVGGGTLDKTSPHKTYLNFRNGLALLYKNLSGNKLFVIVFFRMMLDGIAAFKFLFADSFSHFWAVIRSHIHFYKNLPSLRLKRKQLKSIQLVMDHDEIYPKTIVFEHFLKKKKKFSELDWNKNVKKDKISYTV